MNYMKEKNRFYMEDDNGFEIGEVTFSSAGDSLLIIDHTFVSEAYRGKGIAAKLVKLVVDKAKKENKKIVPLCAFAKAEFLRKPEYQEVEAGRH